MDAVNKLIKARSIKEKNVMVKVYGKKSFKSVMWFMILDCWLAFIVQSIQMKT